MTTPQAIVIVAVLALIGFICWLLKDQLLPFFIMLAALL